MAEKNRPPREEPVEQTLGRLVRSGRLKAARDLAAKLDELEVCYCYTLDIDQGA